MSVRIRGQVPVVNFKQYLRKVQKAVQEEHTKATKAWLIAVLQKIPTYTGTARGTYAPLGRIVGHSVSVGLRRGKTDPNKKKYFIYPKGGRRWPLGFAAGANYSEEKITFRQQGLDVYRARFEFDQMLPYVLWNEVRSPPSFMKLPSNPPWRAHEAGEKAFIRYVNRTMAPRIAKIDPITGTRTISG